MSDTEEILEKKRSIDEEVSFSRLLLEFSASIPFDRRLFRYDIEGSIAHCMMLSKQRIISKADERTIIKGLKEILAEIEAGDFSFSLELEDIHMNIEQQLIGKIGEVGGKLHTARSRNDQISLDLRMYLRDEIEHLVGLISGFMVDLTEVAERYISLIIPGYTHLQRAQPVLFSHHLMAYYEMFKRDRERFQQCRKRANVMPLGSAAIAGTELPIDRDYVARLLGFPEITQNSIDAVSDRDFILEFLADGAIMAMHMSRFSEELILWSTQEFGFISLPDRFCTGSSIMPQKRNPDMAELIRAKTGRVYGALISVLTIMKALPLAYNKDLQEDKASLFDTVDTLKASIQILSQMIRGMEIKGDVMRKAVSDSFMTATDLADYLVERGRPFRSAHRLVGEVIRYCQEKGKALEDLSLEELKGFDEGFASDVCKVLSSANSISRRDLIGGTAEGRVREAIQQAKEELSST